MPRRRRKTTSVNHDQAIGYIRVSTARQGESGLGLDHQRHAIETEAERQGCTLIRIEQDIESGSKRERAALDRALAALRAGDAGTLIVTKVDRIARSLGQFVDIADDFRAHGWRLHVLDMPVDINSPFGRAMLNVLATFAELERELIAERTRDALAQAKARGTNLGGLRANVPVVPDEALAVIRDLRPAGPTKIARVLNDRGIPNGAGGTWSPGTVSGVIQRYGITTPNAEEAVA